MTKVKWSRTKGRSCVDEIQTSDGMGTTQEPKNSGDRVIRTARELAKLVLSTAPPLVRSPLSDKARKLLQLVGDLP